MRPAGEEMVFAWIHARLECVCLDEGVASSAIDMGLPCTSNAQTWGFDCPLSTQNALSLFYTNDSQEAQ